MSPQQFSLRWNNHTKNLVQVFADQFEHQQHVDVTISCQGRFLKAHKIVLGACSPYFQDLFDSHESTPHPIIIMNGYNFDDIRAIVEFMYRGEVMVAETAMQRLLAAAEDLQIKGLSNVRSKRDGNQQFHDEEGEEDEGDGGGGGGGGARDGEDGDAVDNDEHSRVRSRSNSGTFHQQQQQQQTEQVQAKSFVKKRKRARTQSYDNNEMKRKLRIQSKYTASSAATPASQSDQSKDNNNSSSSSSSLQDKDNDIMMTINIDPPVEDDESKDQCGDDQQQQQQKPIIKEVVVAEPQQQKEKIPRPPNSFMIFANEWRRQLAGQFPNESNKEISVRLGLMWKNLAEEVKAKYFNAARRANDDHKKKYPDYHYNPKEARMRKMWKLQQQSLGHLVTASHQ